MFSIHYLRACPFVEMKDHNPKTICKFPRGSFGPNIVIRVIDTYDKKGDKKYENFNLDDNFFDFINSFLYKD